MHTISAAVVVFAAFATGIYAGTVNPKSTNALGHIDTFVDEDCSAGQVTIDVGPAYQGTMPPDVLSVKSNLECPREFSYIDMFI